MTEQEKKSLTFGLRSISIQNFESHEYNGDWDLDAFMLKFGSAITINPPTDYIRIALHLELGLDDQSKSIGLLEAFFFFHVYQLKEKFVKSNGEVEIPSGLLIMLLNISYSTARGIWYTKNIGLSAGRYIPQLLDPASLLVPYEVANEPWEMVT